MSIDSKNGEHLIEVKLMENPAENYHLLAESFIESRRTNPALASVAEFQTEAGKQKLISILKDTVYKANLPIIIAWDPQRQKVAGTLMLRGVDKKVMAEIPSKSKPSASSNYSTVQWNETTNKALENINKFYAPQVKEFDVWNRYPDIDRYAYIQSIVVLEEYARCGIFINMFSQRIAQKCGFEEVISRKYAGEYLNEIPEDMRSIHTHSKYMTYRLGK